MADVEAHVVDSMNSDQRHRLSIVDARIWIVAALLSLSLYVLDFLLEYEVLGEPANQGFLRDDPELSKQYSNSETVDTWLLLVLTIVVVPVILIVADITRMIGHPNRAAATKRSLLWLSWTFIHGFVLTVLITNSIKLMSGRLRPDFIDRCRPDYSRLTQEEQNRVSIYIQDASRVCTGDEQRIRDGRLSFPSGHAAMAFYSFTFVAIYAKTMIQMRKYCDHQLIVAELFLTVFIGLCFVTAAWIALSRVFDNRHRWSDIIGGALVGITGATVSFRTIFLRFIQISKPIGSAKATL